jgi:DNA-binding NtrC family response regulator
MPEMSGNVVLKNIIEINPDAKVIISSGHSEEEIRKIPQAKAYLAKPYCLSTLTETIGHVLRT